MGAEFQVDSLEDMCSLMCDNYIPEKKKLCDTCIYRNNVEQLKPCIIYRDDCEYYMNEEKGMTQREAIAYAKSELKAAYERAEKIGHKGKTKYIEVLEMSLKALEQEPKWIPVSERLPENDEDVLVCYQQGGMEVVYYHIDYTYYPTQYADLNETGWCNENGDVLDYEPIAWMPLPKPYEPQESEG